MSFYPAKGGSKNFNLRDVLQYVKLDTAVGSNWTILKAQDVWVDSNTYILFVRAYKNVSNGGNLIFYFNVPGIPALRYDGEQQHLVYEDSDKYVNIDFCYGSNINAGTDLYIPIIFVKA